MTSNSTQIPTLVSMAEVPFMAGIMRQQPPANSINTPLLGTLLAAFTLSHKMFSLGRESWLATTMRVIIKEKDDNYNNEKLY